MHFFSLKYRNANNRHYLQHPHPSNKHSPPRLMRRSVTGSVRPAAGLGGPSLTRSAVAVHAAVVTLYSTVQNVLDVLNYQVNGHCRET